MKEIFQVKAEELIYQDKSAADMIDVVQGISSHVTDQLTDGETTYFVFGEDHRALNHRLLFTLLIQAFIEKGVPFSLGFEIQHDLHRVVQGNRNIKPVFNQIVKEQNVKPLKLVANHIEHFHKASPFSYKAILRNVIRSLEKDSSLLSVEFIDVSRTSHDFIRASSNQDKRFMNGVEVGTRLSDYHILSHKGLEIRNQYMVNKALLSAELNQPDLFVLFVGGLHVSGNQNGLSFNNSICGLLERAGKQVISLHCGRSEDQELYGPIDLYYEECESVRANYDSTRFTSKGNCFGRHVNTMQKEKRYWDGMLDSMNLPHLKISI